MTLELVPLRQMKMNTIFNFSYTGVLSPEVTTYRLYNDTDDVRHIHRVRGSVGSSPVGNEVIVDVLKNGTSIFSTSGITRPVWIEPGMYTDMAQPVDQIWNPEDYLTVSILSTGTVSPGEDLTLNIIVSE